MRLGASGAIRALNATFSLHIYVQKGNYSEA